MWAKGAAVGVRFVVVGAGAATAVAAGAGAALAVGAGAAMFTVPSEVLSIDDNIQYLRFVRAHVRPQMIDGTLFISIL